MIKLLKDVLLLSLILTPTTIVLLLSDSDEVESIPPVEVYAYEIHKPPQSINLSKLENLISKSSNTKSTPLDNLKLNDNLTCLAVNAFFEAREFKNDIDIIGTMFVSIRRVGRFGLDTCQSVTKAKFDSRGEIIKNKCHFSWVCDGKQDFDKIFNNPVEMQKLRHIKQLAKQVASGKIPDPTNGADHYHRDDIDPNTIWAKDRKRFKPTVKLGSHIYYKDLGWSTTPEQKELFERRGDQEFVKKLKI